jgi:hypothetical protein
MRFYILVTIEMVSIFFSFINDSKLLLGECEDAVKHFQSFAVIPKTKLFCLGHKMRVNVGF